MGTRTIEVTLATMQQVLRRVERVFVVAATRLMPRTLPRGKAAEKEDSSIIVIAN